MLKVGGENVAAAEIEAYLVTHPAGRDRPGRRRARRPLRRGARPRSCSSAAGATATEQELIDFCRGEIATFKVPRYVRFVDEWPMSGTKIQKFRLREQITAELEQAGITEAPKISSQR